MEDGHVVSYVLTQMGTYAYDVRMSCPDEAKMTSKGGVVFTCKHGGIRHCKS